MDDHLIPLALLGGPGPLGHLRGGEELQDRCPLCPIGSQPFDFSIMRLWIKLCSDTGGPVIHLKDLSNLKDKSDLM